MSKKRVQELVEQNRYLEKQNETLKEQVRCLEDELGELNENTVISSMNDMKERYEELVNNSVCCHKFYSLQACYYKYSTTLKSIELINSVIYDNVVSTRTCFENDYYDNALKQNTIKNNLNNIRDRIQLICEIISKEYEEWEDNKCHMCMNLGLD
jgi:hypothetical protein